MFAARNMMFAGALLDPDAAAYIAAVETALGSSITETQKSAIDVFAKAEKLASRWTSIKRLYLPIWGNAAANAVCLKSLASGTFVGGVTHGAGYVQGDGSTGYMSMGTSPSAQGVTGSSGFIFALVRQAESRTGANFTLVGATNVTSQLRIYHITYESKTSLIAPSVSSIINSPNNMVRSGVFYGGATASNARYLRVRRTAGVQNAGSNATTDNTSTSTSAMALMAVNSEGAHQQHTNARIGAGGFGLGLSIANSDAFSANLKTLWETCTGLTLP